LTGSRPAKAVRHFFNVLEADGGGRLGFALFEVFEELTGKRLTWFGIEPYVRLSWPIRNLQAMSEALAL
jgi:hypothetical protein